MTTTVEITAGSGPLNGPLGHELADVLTQVAQQVESLIADGCTVERHVAETDLPTLFNRVGRMSLPLYAAGPPGMDDAPAQRRQWTMHIAGVVIACVAIDRKLAEDAHG